MKLTPAAAQSATPLPALAASRAGTARGMAGASRPRGLDVLCGLVVLAAAALWIDSLREVEIDRITDVGLAAALPVGAFAALSMATLSFALALRHPNVSTIGPPATTPITGPPAPTIDQ